MNKALSLFIDLDRGQIWLIATTLKMLKQRAGLRLMPFFHSPYSYFSPHHAQHDVGNVVL